MSHQEEQTKKIAFLPMCIHNKKQTPRRTNREELA
jgi:hypothetical protein